MPGTPARAGKRPVNSPARDAEQMGAGAYICVNRTPLAASESKFGVTRSFAP